MTAPIDRAVSRERSLGEIVDVYLTTGSMRQAAKQLGMSKNAVHRAIRKARDEWRAQRIERIDEAVDKQERVLDRIAARAWQGWEASTGTAQEVITEEGERDGKPFKITRKKAVKQSGDPRFLAVITQVEQRRAALLGLDSPKTIDVTSVVRPIEIEVRTPGEVIAVTELLANPDRLAGAN